MAGLQTPPWGPEFNATALRFWQPSDSTASWAGACLTSEARVKRAKGLPFAGLTGDPVPLPVAPVDQPA